jgi:hypothetical protein
MDKLGTGVLTWDGGERRSDRYGTVYLLDSPDSEVSVRLAQIKEGAHGELVVLVMETRKSRHIGDLFHGIAPRTPRVGQEITLGAGTLFYADSGKVGLKPDDGREDQWLDMRALYDAHEQTVTLFFKEDGTSLWDHVAES